MLATLAALAVLVLTGAGCGSDGGSSSDDSTATPAELEAAEDEISGPEGSPFERDACDLLTGADVSAVLGKPVEGKFTPGDESMSTPGQCEWLAEDKTKIEDEIPDGIVLFLGSDKVFENTRILAESGNDYETLEGIGDEAYVGTGEGGVMIDGAGITVTPIGIKTTGSATHEMVVDLLERVVANY